MLQTINNKIQRGFSRSAQSYDRAASLHREIADDLFVQVISDGVPSALLDIGCGTGYLTVKLKDHFSNANVIGLDFSAGMLEVARSKHEGIDWVLADGHDLPFADGSFDALVSNLAYQWAVDLTRAFSEARRSLRADGVLRATLFGYHTCQELFQSLDEAKAHTLQFKRLPNQAQIIEALLAGGFKDPKVSSEIIKIEFKTMHKLMAWLKSIGANNLSREGYLGPDALSRAASIYREKFPYLQGVGATFEVIKIYVQK